MEALELPPFASGIPDDLLADLESDCQTLASGQAIDPELRRRLREEGDRVREEIFR